VTEVVTGDAVVLDVSAAAFPSRMAGRLIDMAIQIVSLIVLAIVIGVAARNLNDAAVGAITVVVVVLVIVGYPTVFETLSRGKTFGKMAMGLRVVSDDGGPVRFRQALVRALAGIFEIWTVVLSPVALITSIASARGKRLGDMFAGTYVIHERAPARRALAPEFAWVPAPLASWAAQLELSGLPDQDAEAAGSYLRRYFDLQPAAREALGLQLAAAVAARVSPPPPPGTPPAAYLAAVLAVRHEREQARYLQAQSAAAGYGPAGVGPPEGSPYLAAASPFPAAARPFPAQGDPGRSDAYPAAGSPGPAQAEPGLPETRQSETSTPPVPPAPSPPRPGHAPPL
jgi:uncharacterized RDD family membrane protein YckC